MIGKHIVLLHEVDSTNNYAAKLLSEQKLEHGTVILAEKQTSGRGQRGNFWISNAGSQFTASFYIQTAFLSVNQLVSFNMSVALVVQQTIESLIQEPVFIKWPNDIMVRNKKMGGILIETQFKSGKIEGAIVGIGINIHSESDLSSAISLSDCVNDTIEPLVVLDKMLTIFNNHYFQLKNGNFDTIKKLYLSVLWNYGNEISAKLADETPIHGKIIDVNEEGNLVFQTVDEIYHFGIKEIKFTY
jgi:BirA family biotin operon repressor/biotin-[acetyl-CoA-carboxylase] ligase